MNEHITDKYIKKCDCEAIQGLRLLDQDGGFFQGDWCYTKLGSGCLSMITAKSCWKSKVDIWLPTGDQLDDEIIKIVNKRRRRESKYEIVYYPNSVSLSVKIDNDKYDNHKHSNPLIAKIKLLKQLLEAK